MRTAKDELDKELRVEEVKVRRHLVQLETIPNLEPSTKSSSLLQVIANSYIRIWMTFTTRCSGDLLLVRALSMLSTHHLTILLVQSFRKRTGQKAW